MCLIIGRMIASILILCQLISFSLFIIVVGGGGGGGGGGVCVCELHFFSNEMT